MIIPSIVRPVRILLRPSALKAMRNVMAGDMWSVTGRVRRQPPPPRLPPPGAAEPPAKPPRPGCPNGNACRRRPRLVAERHVRHDLRALLQVAFDQLGVLPVGDTEPQTDWLQLLVDVEPRRARSFRRLQAVRTARRSSSRRWSRRGVGARRWRGAAAAAWGAGTGAPGAAPRPPCGPPALPPPDRSRARASAATHCSRSSGVMFCKRAARYATGPSSPRRGRAARPPLPAAFLSAAGGAADALSSAPPADAERACGLAGG